VVVGPVAVLPRLRTTLAPHSLTTHNCPPTHARNTWTLSLSFSNTHAHTHSHTPHTVCTTHAPRYPLMPQIKFNIAPPIVAFRMFKTLMSDFSLQNVELTASLMESCGRCVRPYLNLSRPLSRPLHRPISRPLYRPLSGPLHSPLA